MAVRGTEEGDESKSDFLPCILATAFWLLPRMRNVRRRNRAHFAVLIDSKYSADNFFQTLL